MVLRWSQYDWRDRFPDRRTFTRASSQSSARLDRWLVPEQLHRWISTAPDAQLDTQGIIRVSPSASQLQAEHTLAEQLGACRYTSSTMRASPQRQQISSQHISRTIPLLRSSAAVSAGCISSGTCACGPPQRRCTRLGHAGRLSERLRQTARRHRPSTRPTQLMQRRFWLGDRRIAAASYAAAVQAGVVWQHYGEQSTFWFYHLARERQAQTTITQIQTPH